MNNKKSEEVNIEKTLIRIMEVLDTIMNSIKFNAKSINTLHKRIEKLEKKEK